jgi:hypothetical protein
MLVATTLNTKRVPAKRSYSPTKLNGIIYKN